MESSVLLTAIFVMPYDHKHGAHHFELENEKERSLRMASILGFSLDPKNDTKEMVCYSKRLEYDVVSSICSCILLSNIFRVLPFFLLIYVFGFCSYHAQHLFMNW